MLHNFLARGKFHILLRCWRFRLSRRWTWFNFERVWLPLERKRGRDFYLCLYYGLRSNFRITLMGTIPEWFFLRFRFKQHFSDEVFIVDFSWLIFVIIFEYSSHDVRWFKYHSNLCQCPIKFIFGDNSRVLKIKEFECLQQKCVYGHFGASLKAQLVL